VGVLVLLVANENPAAEVGPAVAQELAALGVTSLSLLRDDRTTAVALEGWAFDVASSAAEATSAIGGDTATRALQPVLQTLLTLDRALGGGINEQRPASPCRTTSGSSKGGS